MFQLRIPAPDDRLEWTGGDRPEDEAGEVAYEAVVGRGVAEAYRLLGRLEGTLIRTSRPA
jgi:hypothetical protein